MPAAARPVVRPLALERYEIRFTASAEMREKLRVAQDLLGHAIPSGDLAQVFDRALTLLVADLSRKKFVATGQPRRSRGQSDESRNIPADVKRRVGARDQCRCAFVAPNGRRCDERRFLEFHHVVPMAPAASRRSRTSSCGAGPTTATKPISSMGRASGGRAAASNTTVEPSMRA
ncbi:MAG: hypothetical protein DMF77_08180 [Acidobacteria bacterium]|nr:MAG: hypothetical protein DMF77_08180 [Acidobacteriota bacterium]